MNCFECNKEIRSYPCACGFQPKTLAPMQQVSHWIVSDCSVRGCTVQIRRSIDSNDWDYRCKWHKESRAYLCYGSDGLAGDGPMMDRDEFGQDLFSAIAAQAGLRQAERTADVYTFKGMKRQAKAAQDQVQALQHNLLNALEAGTIDPADLTRILEIT